MRSEGKYLVTGKKRLSEIKVMWNKGTPYHIYHYNKKHILSIKKLTNICKDNFL